MDEDPERGYSPAQESDEGILDSDEGVLDRGLSTDGDLEKSTDDDISADLLLMVPVATERLVLGI